MDKNDYSYECEFCEKNFSTKGNLLRHQKTSKYCANIKGEFIESRFFCQICGKSFPLKYTKDEHQIICSKNNTKYTLLLEEHEKLKSEFETFKKFFNQELKSQAEAYESQIRKIKKNHAKELEFQKFDHESEIQKYYFKTIAFLETHDTMKEELERLKIENKDLIYKQGVLSCPNSKTTKISNVIDGPYSKILANVRTEQVEPYNEDVMTETIKKKYDKKIFSAGKGCVISFIIGLLTITKDTFIYRMYARSDSSRAASTHYLYSKNPIMWKRDDKHDVIHHILNVMGTKTTTDYLITKNKNDEYEHNANFLELNDLFYALGSTSINMRQKLFNEILKNID